MEYNALVGAAHTLVIDGRNVTRGGAVRRQGFVILCCAVCFPHACQTSKPGVEWRLIHAGASGPTLQRSAQAVG